MYVCRTCVYDYLRVVLGEVEFFVLCHNRGQSSEMNCPLKR